MALAHLIKEPEHLTPETPVLFLLHGYGSNEEDLFAFRTDLPKDWVIVSFRAPRSAPFEGYSWYDIDLNNPEKFLHKKQALESLNEILQSIIEIKERLGLGRTAPTHLCGFSQGGVLSYALALKNPHLFSKVACLSSYPDEKLLRPIEKDKKKLEHLRFFISHGTDDAIIPLDWGRKGADMLYDLSCYFTFREYMSGHSVNSKNYMDLMDFFSKS